MTASHSDALVLFGVTGALAHEMIFPALCFANQQELTPELATRFLDSADCPQNATHISACSAVNILLRHLKGETMILEQRRNSQLSGPLLKVHKDYAAHIAKFYHCAASTAAARRCYAKNILRFVSDRISADITRLEAKHLSDFVQANKHLNPRSLSCLLNHLSSFLRYLQLTGLQLEDLSRCLPHIRRYRYARIPRVWSEEEVFAILAAVDRNSPKDKRDYAILMMAARLGLRACDIRALTLDQLHWAQSRIVLMQAKTQKPLELPLLDEVGAALIDYLKHGRPKSPHRQVFLRLQPPFLPFASDRATYTIMDACRRRAGITAHTRDGMGMHCFRHTLATRLLSEQVPLNVISDVLGHAYLETTRVYTKVDVGALRTACLDPDAVVSGEVRHE